MGNRHRWADEEAATSVAQVMLGSRTEHQDQVDPAEALMREVGAQLRQVRLERGEDLEQIAQYLRIRSAYLSGIEEGDMSVMPGQTYALGFLRSYADHLGFDGDDLVAQIKTTVADLTGRTRLRIRTPLPESRLPKAPILVLSLAAIAGIYTGWSYVDRSGKLAIETVAEVPDHVRGLALDALPPDEAAPTSPESPEVEGPPVAATPSGPSATADLVGPPPAETPAPVAASRPPPMGELPVAGATSAPSMFPAPETDTAETATPEVDSVAMEPASPEGQATETGLPALEPEAGPDDAAGEIEVAGITAPDPSPDDASPVGEATSTARAADLLALLAPRPEDGLSSAEVHDAENADARVILHAIDVTWVQVSSADQEYVRARTLQPGDVMLVPNRADLELWTGNAGGLQVIVDGEPIPPLGGDGAVVRGVPLDPRLLRPASTSQR